MRGCFGILAISFGMIGLSYVKVIWDYGFLPPRSDTVSATIPRFLAAVLPFIAPLIYLMPMISGGLYGMAWWATRKTTPSARAWALAASYAELALGIPPLSVSTYMVLSHSHGQWRVIVIGLAPLIILSPGIAGVIAFAGKERAVADVIASPQP